MSNEVTKYNFNRGIAPFLQYIFLATFCFTPSVVQGTPISIPDVQGLAGSTVTVTLIDQAASNLDAATIVINFDNTQLEFIEVKTGTLTSNFDVLFNSVASGEELVSLATFLPPVQGSGSLIEAIFRIRSGADTGATDVFMDCVRDTFSGRCIDYELTPVKGVVQVLGDPNEVPEAGTLPLTLIGMLVMSAISRSRA